MKVATKVATGTGGILALLIGVLFYQVSLVRSLASANRELGAVRIRAAMVSLELRRQLDQIEEYTRKLSVTHDEAYAELVGEARDAFQTNLTELKALKVPDTGEVERLAALWQRFDLATAPRAEIAARLLAEDANQHLEEPAASLEGLRRQVLAELNATSAAIAHQVSVAAAASEDAERLTFAVVGVALALSGLILLVTVRSINGPLQRLTEATHQVAEGSFAVQIDAPRGDEFARLAQDFNTMVRRLDELDRLKRGFVSHVSHELKTPLVAMQETNQLLLEETPGPLSPKQRRLLELNLASSRRLSAMIANLLDVSRIDAGAMEYHLAACDLRPLVEATAALFEARAREHDLEVEVVAPSTPLIAPCDADRITQVVANLLDNAVRYAPPGSTVRVTLAKLDGLPPSVPRWALARRPRPTQDSGFGAIAVEDAGPGVPDAHKERIFDRFHQVVQTRRPDGGVGLGLAICREIVEAQGGVVWVADRLAGGSVFTFVLPLATEGADRPSRELPPGEAEADGES